MLVPSKQLLEKKLEAAKITLCASTCWPSSQARVTSAKSLSSLKLPTPFWCFPGSCSTEGTAFQTCQCCSLWEFIWTQVRGQNTGQGQKNRAKITGQNTGQGQGQNHKLLFSRASPPPKKVTNTPTPWSSSIWYQVPLRGRDCRRSPGLERTRAGRERRGSNNTWNLRTVKVHQRPKFVRFFKVF